VQQVGTGYAKWASANFGLNFIDATMCLSPGTATPTSAYPKFFQDGPGGNINPNAGAAYTWNSNCHESFQLQAGSKGKIIMRGSGHQNTGAAPFCVWKHIFLVYTEPSMQQATTTNAAQATRPATLLQTLRQCSLAMAFKSKRFPTWQIAAAFTQRKGAL
jgi:hypothetical protein